MLFGRTSFRQSFAALKHRNFRLFWFGQCISLLGTWMQQTAQTWLVYSMTKSPFLLGILGVFQYAPILFLSLFAGVLVDRFPKKKLLMIIQILMMLQAVIFTILLYTNHIQYWHILVLSAFLGLLNTFDLPVRQSLLIEMVGREDLMGAIALNGVIVNIARIVGPAMAGVILVYGSTKLCFLLNSISFLAVIFCVSHVKIVTQSVRKVSQSIFREAWEGILYIVSHSFVSKVLLTVIIIGTFAMNSTVLIPVFVKDVLHLEAQGYTTMLSCIGVGSLLGAMFVSSRSKAGPNRKFVFGSAILMGICLLVFGVVKNYSLALVCAPVFGFLNMVFLTSANSSIQLSISNDFRGRVMSIYGLAFMGTTPIGNFYAGTITEYWGAGWGFIVCGATTLALVIILLFKIRKSECKLQIGQ